MGVTLYEMRGSKLWEGEYCGMYSYLVHWSDYRLLIVLRFELYDRS
jgi:hypothetical protein